MNNTCLCPHRRARETRWDCLFTYKPLHGSNSFNTRWHERLRLTTPVPPSRTLTNTPLGSGSTWFTRMYKHGMGSNPNTPARILTVCTGHAHIYFRWLQPIMWKHRPDLRLRWVLNDNRARQMTEESDLTSVGKPRGGGRWGDWKMEIVERKFWFL